MCVCVCVGQAEPGSLHGPGEYEAIRCGTINEATPGKGKGKGEGEGGLKKSQENAIKAKSNLGDKCENVSNG